MDRVEQRLLPVISRIWPEMADLSDIERQNAVVTFGALLYIVPLSLIGFVWLAAVSNLRVLSANWGLMLALFALIAAFQRFYLFLIVEISPGVYGTTASSVEGIVTWSAALVFGPSVLWLIVLADLTRLLIDWERDARIVEKMTSVRDALLNTTSSVIPALLGLAVYRQLGGTIPIGGLALPQLLPALYATVIHIASSTVLALPLTGLYLRMTAALSRDAQGFRAITRTLMLWFGLTYLTLPLAAVIAGIFAASGPFVYLFILGAVLVANIMGSRLSLAVERTRQRTRELERLEQLGRALLGVPFNPATLPEVLREYLPGMFSHSLVELRRFPDEVLVRYPEDWSGAGESVWQYIRANPEPHQLSKGSHAPWSHEPLTRHVLLLPIVDVESGEAVGGLFISRHPSQGSIDAVYPAAQSLAAQVASALHSIKVYRDTLQHQRSSQELEIARNIQASFLPDTPPAIEGWQITASLVSARETSGDFFDLIPLWDGRLGIVIADVADKGVGAALYMALARTLIRTYLTEYSSRYPDNYAYHPERVLNTANQCILQDTHSDLFVTVFLGILDPRMSILTYANAGHNPPLLFRHRPGRGEAPLRALVNTGIPLGVLPGVTWERGSVGLMPGDLLVMYTDGITEARNAQGEFFGEDRLRAVVRRHLGESAQAVREGILQTTLDFIDDAPQDDDITLLVVRRELPSLDDKVSS
ncbi:MAG: PP2C family protein-serine/threonine phosphatase [Chloroflexi bacterium]|nr:PP2C family protein-serine/threonine phosphatase [Chloroflexota bacterium]